MQDIQAYCPPIQCQTAQALRIFWRKQIICNMQCFSTIQAPVAGSNYGNGAWYCELSPTPDSSWLWVRPSTLFARIHPSDFEGYRKSHQFIGPSCFCPAFERDGPEFVESAMFMVDFGPFAGQYVAACAEDRCGYLGKPVEIPLINLALTRGNVQYALSICTTEPACRSSNTQFEVCPDYLNN